MKELLTSPGFDVSDPEAWEHIGSVDLACLNAGVLTGSDDIAGLTDEQYRRAVGVNVDGVVFGVRRLDRVMPKGSTIIVTASLAGLVGIPDDPVYGLTKHAVVGFVRSVAPQLAERGIRIQAVCPGWADTALTPPEFKQELESRGFRLLSADAVAAGVWAAYESEGTGEAWIVQPGREPLLYEFKGVPGPLSPEARPAAPLEPPGSLAANDLRIRLATTMRCTVRPRQNPRRAPSRASPRAASVRQASSTAHPDCAVIRRAGRALRELDQRDLDACPSPSSILLRGVERHEPAGLNLGGGVRDPVLHRLLLGERPPNTALERVRT